MNIELKKRIFTAIPLFLILILMFIFKTVYLFISIIVFIISFLEFSKIIKKIFKHKKIYQLIFNLIFIFYLTHFLFILFLGINDIHFRIILFIILLVCIASDIGGITFGRIFKGRKLTKISPRKTIAGSLGSFCFSMIISLFLFYSFIGQNIIFSLAFGCVVSLSVQIGDLFFSFLKRKSLLKNTGNLLPGHGGILDRIDGILLGLPIGLFILLTFLN